MDSGESTIEDADSFMTGVVYVSCRGKDYTSLSLDVSPLSGEGKGTGSNSSLGIGRGKGKWGGREVRCWATES